ncbi:MAG TPA: hypothetical protein VFM00_06310 [Candidatus Eisenbacteria bacterium]|jgi:hypothetical protein|nr:hypothetical protein [Candidatus Eisenbacteria bacterium]
MRGAWLAIALACSPVIARPVLAVAAYLHEFPHPVVAVQFHPRGDRRFQVSDLENALHLGASAAELTVVISGFRAALERSIAPAALDTLCIVEAVRASAGVERRP